VLLLPWYIPYAPYRQQDCQQYQDSAQYTQQAANNNGRHDHGAQNQNHRVSGRIRAEISSVRGSGGRTIGHHLTIGHLTGHGVQLLPVTYILIIFILAVENSKVNRKSTGRKHINAGYNAKSLCDMDKNNSKFQNQEIKMFKRDAAQGQ
jgi:hypothetical protein